MIGKSLKELAAQYDMILGKGVAYGSVSGFATTFSQGMGYKRLDITTYFPETEARDWLQKTLSGEDLTGLYGIRSMDLGQKYISVYFTENPQIIEKIKTFIEWFYPLLTQSNAEQAHICTQCGEEVTEGGWYLVNGMAYHFHRDCAAEVSEELDYEERLRRRRDPGSYIQGVVGAALGATLGGVVWGAVMWLGYITSVIGLLIGWLAEKGYTLLRGRKGRGKIVILILAVTWGVVLGTLLPDGVTLWQMISVGEFPGYHHEDIPRLLAKILSQDPAYLRQLITSVVWGLFYAGLGTAALLIRSKEQLAGRKMKKLS